MVSHMHVQTCSHQLEQFLQKIASKLGVSITYDMLGHSMKFEELFDEKIINLDGFNSDCEKK